MIRSHIVTIIAPVCLALMVSGCSTQRVVTAIKPPPERLVCANEPDAPSGEITDAVTADYLIAIRGSWQDCSSSLKWISEYFDGLPD
jgi:hypothetical protein